MTRLQALMRNLICVVLPAACIGVHAQVVLPPYDVYSTLKTRVGEYEIRLGKDSETQKQISGDALAERRKKMAAYYEGHVNELRKQESAAQLKTKAALENFVARYPKDSELTPYSMMILGQQYFIEDESKFFDSLEASNESRTSDARADFSRTIVLYKRLIEKFPSYRFADAAYYLMGICYLYEDRFDDAIAIWRKLVAEFPASSFRDEAWFRIGEDYFSERRFAEAAEAYQVVLKNEKSAFYDKALYKLSWTYYLLNRYDEAIAGFTQVLDFRVSQTKGKSETTGSVLETESEQYLAISFSDKDWGDIDEQGLVAVQSMQDYFKRIGARRYERQVFINLADLLLKVSKQAGAELALSHAISLEPNHPANPELSTRVIKALDDARQIPQAMAARKNLIIQYGPSSAWERANAENKQIKALQDARKLIRDELLKLATFEHAQAKQYQTEGKVDEAKALFQEASRTYVLYVKLFPEQDDIDKVLYFLAESSFDSGWYADAAQAFIQTRDWPWDTQYRQQAAVNLVYAYEKEIVRRQQLRYLPDFELSSIKTEQKAKLTGPVPTLLVDFVKAVDVLVAKYPELPELPAFMFQTAGIYYAYGDLVQANQRFDALVAKYPQLDTARLAANLILEDKLAKGNWTEAAQEAARFRAAKIGGVSQEFEQIELGARFKGVTQEYTTAQQLFEQGKISDARVQYGKAADSYLTLLKDDPKSEHADKMLYNAGIALDLAKRPDEAAMVFQRLFTEHPKSELAQVAMSQRAAQFEQTLEFDRAAKAYIRLAEAFPKAEKSGDAFLNAGLLYEADQEFVKAADVFEQFSKRYPERAEAADAYIRAANLYGKAKNEAQKTRLLESFVKKYRGDLAQRGSVVEASVVLGDMFAEQAQSTTKREARAGLQQRKRQAYEDAVKLSKSDKESSKATYYGAKAEFLLLEDDFNQYDAMKINASLGKQQGKELTAKTARLSELKKSYENIVRGQGDSEWTVGALYQIGALYEDLYRALLDAPCPSDVESVDEDACDEYRSLLEDKAFVLEEKALEAFKLTKEHASRMPGAARWVFKAQTALHRMKPMDYPVPDRPIGEPIVTRDFAEAKPIPAPQLGES